MSAHGSATGRNSTGTVGGGCQPEPTDPVIPDENVQNCVSIHFVTIQNALCNSSLRHKRLCFKYEMIVIYLNIENRISGCVMNVV